MTPTLQLIIAVLSLVTLLPLTAVCALAGADAEGRGGAFVPFFFVFGALSIADLGWLLIILVHVIWRWSH